MASLFRTRITAVWLALVLATLFSWSAGTGQDETGLRNAIIVAVSLIKSRFVMLDFMETRSAPIALRSFVEMWVVVVGGALIVLTA